MSLFGVVRSLSPVKIEFAPARKQNAWSDFSMKSRPADSLTTLCGIRILAVAMYRTSSRVVGSFELFSLSLAAKGVPSTGTNEFTGTDSGWLGRVARVWRSDTLSSSVSPRPRIPPQHTLIPASLTFCKVLSRSEYLRVEMMVS